MRGPLPQQRRFPSVSHAGSHIPPGNIAQVSANVYSPTTCIIITDSAEPLLLVWHTSLKIKTELLVCLNNRH